MAKLSDQQHLEHATKINLGAFYTPQVYIDLVWSKIKPFLNSRSVILDSSCGYGNFFNYPSEAPRIANDIDPVASDYTHTNFPNLKVFNRNALLNVHRAMFDISGDEDLIIIGNPPYNDTTSIIRNGIKNSEIETDSDLKTRDYGLSFLRSYHKLKANVVCVLHPLSYLIKKSNFKALKQFAANYRLIDAVIIDSKTFKETSKSISFPIIIALYKRAEAGMTYDYIQNYKFKTFCNKSFTLKDFDFISNYIPKYPLKNKSHHENDLLFWTMRDINALKRNRTFVHKFSSNTIVIDLTKLDYYIYVDVFKKFSYLLPYYFGNLEVFINQPLFENYKSDFISESLFRNRFLKNYVRKTNLKSLELIKQNIIQYFKLLMEEHCIHRRT